MGEFVFISVLFWLGCAYSLLNVALSGGPNHGEHPLTVTLCHMIGFAIYRNSFVSFDYALMYAGLLVVLVVLSVYAMTLVGRYLSPQAWIARSLFLVVYGCQYWLILTRR
jgi:hypothetical protein